MVEDPSEKQIKPARGAEPSSPNQNQVVEDAKRLDPAEQMEVVSQIMTSVSMQGTVPNPIHQRVNEEHISQAIELAGKHDERAFILETQRENRRDSNRWFFLVLFVISILAVAVACWGFYDSPQILAPLLTGLFGLGTGFIGGYGYSKSRPNA